MHGEEIILKCKRSCKRLILYHSIRKPVFKNWLETTSDNAFILKIQNNHEIRMVNRERKMQQELLENGTF